MSHVYEPSKENGKMARVQSTEKGSLDSSDLSRVLPRQLSTGTMRGTQNVGYGNAKIDGTNNRITVGDGSGATVGMGSIPGSTTNEFGFFSLDANGKLILKIVDGTKYVYDPSNNYTNITQDGLLPDGTGGFVAAKPGVSVDSLFV